MRIAKRFLAAIFLMSAMIIIGGCASAFAQDTNLVVRIAKLQIDPSKLEIYKAALKEEITISVRVEAGVLSLNAVYEKNNPTRVTILEIYANEEAYQAHLQTPHFVKYKKDTKDMVKSLELVETIPIALETKPKIPY